MKRFLLSAVAMPLAATLAFAAGGTGTSGSGTTPAPMNSPIQMHCKKGEVVKTVKKNGKTTKSCVRVTGSLLPDNDLYHQGWVLAKAGEYDWAIEVLSQVKDPSNPDVLTMLGYSNRKAGRFEVGFDFYNKALALNPDHVRAHEYLGEGFAAQGRIEEAKLQLGEVQRICGNTSCEEYQDLSNAIQGKGEDL
jgi:tetratricopeptide (TPR) repeat protein